MPFYSHLKNSLLPEHSILRCYVYLLLIRNNSILLLLYEQTNKMHFLYVFILQFFCTLYMFRTTVSFIIRSSLFTVFCSSVQTVR